MIDGVWWNRARLAVLLGLAAMTAACGAHRFESPRPSSRDAAETPYGSRGNPVFYEVFGERYYVMRSSAGYRERGLASWYGSDFHGRPTSSGEIYDMHSMTAAHKTLPIPTWVEVTNLDNGRRITVKVNDRGPFVGGRIIDLSYRAATALDIVQAGTQMVEVRALNASSRRSAVLQEPAPTAVSGVFSLIGEAVAQEIETAGPVFQRLYLQLGAFADHGNAMNLEQRLRMYGIDNSFVVLSSNGNDDLHRVRIGPLEDVADFDRVSAWLHSLGFDGMHLVVE